jgi:hypothetical protein
MHKNIFNNKIPRNIGLNAISPTIQKFVSSFGLSGLLGHLLLLNHSNECVFYAKFALLHILEKEENEV